MIAYKERPPMPALSPGTLALGTYVRNWRLANRYSQRGFGELVGKKQVAIGEIERGENNITLELLRALAKAMGKDPLELASVYYMANAKAEEPETPPANKSDAAAKRAKNADTINQLRKRKEKEQVEKDKGGLIKN